MRRPTGAHLNERGQESQAFVCFYISLSALFCIPHHYHFDGWMGLLFLTERLIACLKKKRGKRRLLRKAGRSWEGFALLLLLGEGVKSTKHAWACLSF